MPTKSRRRRTGRKRDVTAARKPSGQIRYADSTLPTPEVIARRGANWQDQDAGDVFGIMQARGMLPDKSGERTNGVPGPTPRELKVTGQGYAALVARYEHTIAAPVCAVAAWPIPTRTTEAEPDDAVGRRLSGGSGAPSTETERHARTQAQMLAALSVLRRLDHRCTIAMARAVAAVTAEQIDDALRWPDAIVQALLALHEASDDIRRAGRAAAERVEMEEAA